MSTHSRPGERSTNDHRSSHPLGDFAMSYTKPCNKCGVTITIIEINGNWHAFEDSTATTIHKCIGVPSTTYQDKIKFLEKNLRRLYDMVQLQSEQIRKLEQLNEERT